MIRENLKLLLQLYYRPFAAMSAVVDEGSILFGAIAVLLTSVLLQAGNTALVFKTAMDAAREAPAAQGMESDSPSSEGIEEPEAAREQLLGQVGLGLARSSLFSTLLSVVGLAVLYVPAAIFVVTLFGRQHGSFGVALRRDYGSVAACAFMGWTVSHLPIAFLGLGLLARSSERAIGFLGPILLSLCGVVYFGALMVAALRTIYGLGVGAAITAVFVATLTLPFQGFLAVLASPFALYWLYLLLRGDIRDIQWSLGARRSLKRHLEAATLNPRDAEAHYQLGLIHQHRRQYAEAIERFQKAVEIDPAEIDAHYQLGRIAREQQRYAGAIRHFEVVVARDEKYARHEVWREVGATYVGAGDFANARPMLERYVENRPYDPEGLYLLGLALKKLGEPERGNETLRRCIEATRTAPDYRKGELRRWRKLAARERQGP